VGEVGYQRFPRLACSTIVAVDFNDLQCANEPTDQVQCLRLPVMQVNMMGNLEVPFSSIDRYQSTHDDHSPKFIFRLSLTGHVRPPLLARSACLPKGLYCIFHVEFEFAVSLSPSFLVRLSPNLVNVYASSPVFIAIVFLF